MLQNLFPSAALPAWPRALRPRQAPVTDLAHPAEAPLEQRPRRRLGILGGQGALASAQLHQRLIEAWARRWDCSNDSDYPAIVHLSESLPGLGPEGLHDRDAAALALRERMWMLAFMHVKTVAVACNSLDGLAQDAGEFMGVTVHTPWSVARQMLSEQELTVLCSRSRRTYCEEALKDSSWRLCSPDSQCLVDEVIGCVLQGQHARAKAALSAVVASSGRGTRVLLACTELSVAYAGESGRPALGTVASGGHVEVVDAMDLLVQALVKPALPA